MLYYLDSNNICEVLKDRQKNPQLKKIPFIVCTSDKNIEEECFHLSINDFVKKPYENPDIIVARIKRMIRKFVENNSYNAVIDAYSANNIKEVFVLAHSFKGVTGNLALTNLYNIASDLTELTRDKETADIDKEIEKIKKSCQ